jgi:hypothetical protein
MASETYFETRGLSDWLHGEGRVTMHAWGDLIEILEARRGEP